MPVLCTFLLLVPDGASTLWPLAISVGLLCVLRGGPRSTFLAVLRGKRTGKFFPSCRTTVILSDLRVGLQLPLRRQWHGPLHSQRRVEVPLS